MGEILIQFNGDSNNNEKFSSSDAVRQLSTFNWKKIMLECDKVLLYFTCRFKAYTSSSSLLLLLKGHLILLNNV